MTHIMATLYRGPIIDPHHHLWDLALGRHPRLTLASGEAPSDPLDLRRDYLVRDYLADAAGQGVVATVHVEAAWLAQDCLGETRWLETLDKQDGVASRYVAHVPLARPDVADLVAAQAGFARTVGIRDILSWHPDPTLSFAARRDVMDDPDWRRGLATLAAHDLVFDMMIFATQLDDANRLVRDFPNQFFVLNHSGSPIDQSAEGIAAWRKGIDALGASENVAIKISALTGYDPDWTEDRLRMPIAHCIDAFGPERTMFASDFPVTRLHATYAQTYDLYRSLAASYSAEEQTSLFLKTAARVYRISIGDPAGGPKAAPGAAL